MIVVVWPYIFGNQQRTYGSLQLHCQWQGDDRAHSLIASMAYLDSWAYMMYNGCEKEIPNVDHATANLPRNITTERGSVFSSIEAKYGVKLDIYSIISDPNNKIWMQGAPAIFLNKDAPLQGRALDAIACAVRTSCDQANNRFATLVKENGTCAVDKKLFFQLEDDTPTSSAVLANENELCNRSIVASAHMLIKQHDASKQGNEKNEGLYLAISALDAFLEIDDGDLEGGFTDSQIQSLLSVCHSTVENPLILYHAGPTYHIVTNATIMLCHFLNSMHAMRSTTQFGPMEATLFEEVVDTVVAVRKLLTVHRRKLPVKLRCHGIPRPTLEGIQDGQPFIDLGETQLCPCRSCQGFVLLACSPSVAAERVRSAASRLDVAIAQEAEAVDLGELSSIGGNAGGSNDSGGGAEENADFDLDDDALISLLGRLIAN